MLKKIIQIVKGSSKAVSGKTSQATKRVEVPVKTHGIDRDLIDPRAIETVETLQDAGFETYIVGGAVIDLLLGLHPKDFDIATSATPEEVKRLFRRAFIIGRRFRIVHVIFGGGRDAEVFEVSTFRANVDVADATKVKGNEKSKSKLEGLTHAVDSSGRVLRDNVWGDIASDAARRDFTVNAMYYDPSSEVLVDYHGGMDDAKRRVIRMIGEPAARYREDPVRIIRAVRFSAKLAKLGFKLEPKTLEPIKKLKKLLEDVPPSRMFDEMLKLVQTGHSLASIQTLKELGLERGIYPLLDVIVERSDSPMVKGMLSDTDERVKAGKPVAPSYLLACVLWQDVIDGWTARREGKKPFNKIPTFPALAESVDAVFEERIGDVSGRGKLGADMREIWMMQPRFEKRVGSSPHTLVDHLRFRAGFDFLRLRGECGAEFGETNAAELAELAAWWQDFQDADHAGRMALIEQARLQPKAAGEASAKSTKPRRKRKPKGVGNAVPSPLAGEG